MNSYDKGYKNGSVEWVEKFNSLPLEERHREIMNSFILAVKTVMWTPPGHHMGDYACGFSQALHDREAIHLKNLGIEKKVFIVSDMAYAIAKVFGAEE